MVKFLDKCMLSSQILLTFQTSTFRKSPRIVQLIIYVMQEELSTSKIVVRIYLYVQKIVLWQ